MTASVRSVAAAPRYVTLMNPLTRRLLNARVPLGPNALLTVRGRISGDPRTTPLAIIKRGGRRWVWSPWGEVNWVRNLRAAGRAMITVRGTSEEVLATELKEQERVAFFRDVLTEVAQGIPLGYWFVRLVDQTDLRDPIGSAEGRAVFELTGAHADEATAR